MSVGSGKSFPLGASIQPGGVNFSLYLRARHGRPAAAVRSRRRRQAGPDHRARAAPAAHLSLLARLRAGPAGGPDLRLAGRGAAAARPRPAVRSGQGAARPLRPRGRDAGGLRSRRRLAAGRQCRGGGQERGGRLRRLRLGGRSAALPAVLEQRDLRDARARLHAPPELRRRRGEARHLCRPDREDPVSRRSRHHRGRAPARVPVRPAGCAGRADQLLGLCADLVLRAARRLQRRSRTPAPCSTSSATWSRRCTGRASRSSSTWSTTTPPRATSAGRPCAFAAWTTRPTTSSSRTGRATRTSAGTGNTLNGNHPIVRRMIVDSLRYWVREMHVDGFRFDLASILSRDETGAPLANPPVLWDIETDPSLAGVKLIAEAWDAGGLYQVGSFIGDRWKEWNGQFRDDVRSFVRGEPGMVAKIASRFLASPDIYRPRGARARAEHQLRHLPRRLHAERPRLLRRQAQRGERRGQPGRPQRQPQLELRHRGAERRSGDRAAARAPGQEPARGDPAGARHADAADGRRDAAHAARQQQRLLPGQRDQLARLGACWSGTAICIASSSS